MERMAPTQEQIRRSYPDDLPERLERFREVAGLSWRELPACLGMVGWRVAAWRKGRVPSSVATCTPLQLPARAPDDLVTPCPEFSAGCANDGGEGEEPWA